MNDKVNELVEWVARLIHKNSSCIRDCGCVIPLAEELKEKK